MTRLTTSALVVLARLLTPLTATAQVDVSAQPSLGEASLQPNEWGCITATLRSTAGSSTEGTLELRDSEAATSALARAPFAVHGAQLVQIEMPLRVPDAVSGDLWLVTRDREGHQVSGTRVTRHSREASLELSILDLAHQAPLAGALSGHSARLAYPPYPNARSHLAVARPPNDPTTGDPLLPSYPACWRSTHLAVVSTERLLSWSPANQRAIADAVLDGLTLALTVSRPSDLTHPTLVRLLGGVTEVTAVSRMAFGARAAAAPKEGEPEPSPVETHFPSRTTIARATGFKGGNLSDSPFGSQASYGLGRIELLAVDLTDSELLGDPWVVDSLVELASQSHTTRQSRVVAPGPTQWSLPSLRRTMDPNRRAVWPIPVATALLLLYSVLIGPFEFWRAQRKGQPLAALRRLPIYAGLMAAAIAAIGLLSRATLSTLVLGQTDRFSVTEVGAGLSRGSTTRYTSLFAPRAKTHVIDASSATGLLGLLSDEPSGTLVSHRGRVRLDGVMTLPWTTYLLREDRLTDLPGQVSLSRRGTSLTVTNHLPYALEASILIEPRNPSALVLPAIPSGASLTRTASELSGVPLPSALHSDPLSQLISDKLGRSGTLLRSLLQPNGGPPRTMLPLDQPVLIATVAQPRTLGAVAGLPLQSDSQILVVTGLGGTP